MGFVSPYAVRTNLMLIKKSKNPYLNLVKSLKQIHFNSNINVSDKIEAYTAIIGILTPDLEKYKFYTHPAFNDNFYAFESSSNTKISSMYNVKNPWQLFLKNILKILNSPLFDEESKDKNIACELNWFYNTPRVYDWIITKRKGIKYAKSTMD